MRYSEFRPTQFDHHIDLDDRENWLVLPASINRDTEDPVTLSNWRVAIAELENESVKHEIHRFGHWGHGWFEIIIVHPEHSTFVENMESALADYAVLDEDDLCEVEHEKWCEDYQSFWRSEIIDGLKKTFADYIDYIETPNDDVFDAWLFDHISNESIYPEFTNEGSRIDIDRLVNSISDQILIDLILRGTITLDFIDSFCEDEFNKNYAEEFAAACLRQSESYGQARLFER